MLLSPARPLVLAGAVVGLLVVGAAPALADATISSAGPLTAITTTSDLNCAVNRVDDTRGEWYEDTACGTLLVVGGVLYGPSAIPFADAATPRTPWTPVSQSAVTGTGSEADPFTVVTVVAAGGSGVTLEQTDRYVEGEDGYRSSLSVRRAPDSPAGEVTLYRAGDCFLGDNDFGFGDLDLDTGAVTCRAVDPDDDTAPGTRILQLLPTTGGSTAREAFFNDIWDTIGNQAPFDNTCRCTEMLDNGIGLSWVFDLAPGATVTQSLVTTFSPIDNQPLVTAKTVDDSEVEPGEAVVYTITVTNPGSAAATLDTVTDLLPEGFAYVPGSTTGATTSDPTISAVGTRSSLSWTVSELLSPDESLSLSFSATASQTPGAYGNDAGGTSEDTQVAPFTGARVIVTDAPTPVVPEAPWAALLPVAAVGLIAVGMRRRLAA